MSLDEDQLKAYQDFISGRNLFITGPGGTGKSFLLRVIMYYCKTKQLAFGLTATTGVAASLIGGVTIHSWAGIGTGEDTVDKLIQKINNKFPLKKKWLTTKILIIDEISMLSEDLLDKLNTIAKTIKCRNKPFGGMQLIFTGDFCQLPPVNGQFAFHSNAWKEINPNMIHLTKQHRQSEEDKMFSDILNEIRMGRLSPEGLDVLRTREVAEMNDTGDLKPTILYPHRAEVESINHRELSNLPGDPMRYISNDYYFESEADEASGKIKQIPDNLKFIVNFRNQQQIDLKVGAQVMLTANLDTTIGMVNGARGVITGIGQTYVMVKWAVGPTPYDTLHYNAEKIQVGEKIFYRSQIPLILAWALTIHKIQGSTLDLVVADLRKAFEFGQVYVALSRVKNLKGLNLLGFNPEKIKCHPDVLKFYGIPMPDQSQSNNVSGISLPLFFSSNNSVNNAITHPAIDQSTVLPTVDLGRLSIVDAARNT